MSDDNNPKNVVNLAEARRRQRTVRAGASGKDGKASGKTPAKKIWVYVQFLLFLGIVAYLMQLCSHPGR